MSGGCIHTPVHKYDCWNHGNGACIEKGEDICRGCLSIARSSGINTGFDSGEAAREADVDRAYGQAWEEALGGMEEYIAESRAVLKRARERRLKQARGES